MKTRLILLCSLSLGAPLSLPAEESATTVPVAPARFTSDQLDQLLGPIALYPDALVALILPASDSPSDIVLAARYLQGGGDRAQVDRQSWDDSVTALAHYPEIIAWMDENLAWTKQLGEAFDAQPADVMRAVQRLRAKARAAGTLANSPEQQVVVEGTDILILPAQADVIYVPRYDPNIVYYMDRPDGYADPYLTYGPGFAAGLWLSYDVDWSHHRIWVGDRHGPPDRRDWQHPVYPGQPGYVRDPGRHLWNPPPNFDSSRPRPSRQIPPTVALPTPLPGTPARPAGWLRGDQPDRRVALPPNQPPPINNGIRPPPLQSPLPQSLPSPLPQPIQPPLAQPLRPVMPDRRSPPEQMPQRSREAPPPPPAAVRQAPPAAATGIRQAPPAAPAPPPASSDDEKKRQ